MENGCICKVTSIGDIPFFTEPWLWEEGYNLLHNTWVFSSCAQIKPTNFSHGAVSKPFNGGSTGPAPVPQILLGGLKVDPFCSKLKMKSGNHGEHIFAVDVLFSPLIFWLIGSNGTFCCCWFFGFWRSKLQKAISNESNIDAWFALLSAWFVCLHSQGLLMVQKSARFSGLSIVNVPLLTSGKSQI